MTATGIARLAIAFISIALTPVLAFAQPYPNKPLRFIVPYPAGRFTRQLTQRIHRSRASGHTKIRQLRHLRRRYHFAPAWRVVQLANRIKAGANSLQGRRTARHRSDGRASAVRSH